MTSPRGLTVATLPHFQHHTMPLAVASLWEGWAGRLAAPMNPVNSLGAKDFLLHRIRAILVQLKLNPRPRAARGHADHLLGVVVAGSCLRGGVPKVLIVRGLFAVKPRGPRRGKWRGKEPRVGPLREDLSISHLSVHCGGEGGALEGRRQGVGGEGLFVIDCPPFGQSQIPGVLEPFPLWGGSGCLTGRYSLGLGRRGRVRTSPGGSTR